MTLTTVEIVGDSVRLTRGEDVTTIPFGTVTAMANILREHLLALMPAEIPPPRGQMYDAMRSYAPMGGTPRVDWDGDCRNCGLGRRSHPGGRCK